MSSANSESAAHLATGHALRAATAAAICLVIGEWFQLKHTNLAVWTTFMVMAQYQFTSFQKGIERVLGRGLGILAGLLIANCFDGAFGLSLVALTLLLIFCFYLYFSGHLAYTFLNTGLYAVLLYEIGNRTPSTAWWEGQEMFFAIVLGVAVADAVLWVVGTEQNLHIELGEAPLWPVQFNWLNQSMMLAVTVLITARVADGLNFPVDDTAISVMLLTITPDIQSLLVKGELRIEGAFLASAFAVFTFFLLTLEPYFSLLVGMLFLGIFLATYLTRAGGAYSYAGLQMGLVLPMLVVASPTQFGSFSAAIGRLQGIVLAIVGSLLVGGLWPHFPFQSTDRAA
jgi:uncharacterized membrane protein YccC